MSYGCTCVDGQKEPRIENGREFCSGCGEMTAAEWNRTLTPKRNPYPNHPAPPNRVERFMQKQVDLAAERRLRIRAENAWRISDTDFNAQAIAKAEAKRQRKAARRLAPAKAAVSQSPDTTKGSK